MTESRTQALGDVAAIMRDRGTARDSSSTAFSGSTGDIVRRLKELGFHTAHKTQVGEVADMLFGTAVRPRPSAHRRISDEQFEVLSRVYALCKAYGYTVEELAQYLRGDLSREEIRAHLDRGLALLDTIEVLAAVPGLVGDPVTPRADDEPDED